MATEAAKLAAVAALAEQVEPTMLVRDQQLPILPALASLVPAGGLRRGSTVSVVGSGATTSLALALAAGPSADGAWVAAMGFGHTLGLQAASEFGVALERLVLVAAPDAASWASVAAALVDAFEVVLVRTPDRVKASDGRRLAARVRERRGVLVQVGAAWPEGADIALRVRDTAWEGLGEGHGHLRARRVTVRAGGRRDAARERDVELWLPSVDGEVALVLPEPVPLAARRGRAAS